MSVALRHLTALDPVFRMFPGLVPGTPPAFSPFIPSGLGMWVGAFGRKPTGTPDEVAARVRKVGIRWLAALWVWQDPGGKTQRWNRGTAVAEYVAAARETGADLWVWGWPRPGRHEAFVEAMLEGAARLEATGVILDPERPWLGRADDVRQMMALALERFHAAGLTVGVSSYGAPWNYPSLPWAELATADFGVPQAYDLTNRLRPDYPTASAAAYREAGFRVVLPAFATVGKTPAQLRTHLGLMPDAPALIGWSWRHTSEAEWRVIADERRRRWPRTEEVA